MKSALIEDPNNIVLEALSHSVSRLFFLMKNMILPKAMSFDSTTIHYKHWTRIVFNPYVKTFWRKVLEKYYNTDTYRRINEVVYGNEALSKYASLRFLLSLTESVEKTLERNNIKVDKSQFWDQCCSLADKNPLLAKQMLQGIAEVENEMKRALEEIVFIKKIQSLSQSYGYTHEAISLLKLLEKPDELRKMIANRIIVNFTRFLEDLRNKSLSPKYSKAPSLTFGRPLSVKRIQRWCEINRAIPLEFIDNDILNYRVASRTLRVTEMYSGVPDHVIYLDKCIASGTLIPLVNGVKPIEEVEPGDIVLGAVFVNGKPMLTSSRVVEKKYSGIQDTIRIKTKIGEEIVLTPNHIVYAVRKGERKVIETYAGYLKEGDKLLIALRYDTPNNPRLSPIKKKKQIRLPKLPKKINQRLWLSSKIAQVLGYICGDGYVSISPKSSSAYIAITDDNDDHRILYKKIIEELFGVSVKLVDRDRKRIQINSRPLALWLKENFPECVCRSKNREVPKIVLEGNTKVITGFLRGLFDAEGFVGNHQVSIATTSKKLAEQVRYLLLRLGIYSKIYHGHNPERVIRGKVVKASDIFWVIISGQVSLERFLKYIGFSCEDRNKKIQQYLAERKIKIRVPRSAERIGKSHFILSEIVSIEPAGETHTWDLVVEGNHNFIANNILVHNSGSMGGLIKYCKSPDSCGNVPKISFAAASSIALAYALRRIGAKMTLKFFDTEVHDPVTRFYDIVKTLMTIEADGGTNITNVLEDAIANHGDDKIVIVSDGIDNVKEDVVRKAKAKNLDVTVVFINTDNTLLRKNFKHIHLKEAKPDILLYI